ncbi:MAG: tetratricopeptide repeat protein [Rudaea sp.]
MINETTRRARLILLCLLGLTAVAAAETQLRPVPNPDTAKLAPEAAKLLSTQRAEFDKVKPSLVGPPLAQAYADLGALYARGGFDEAAAVAFADASQVTPDDSRWYYLRGVIARKLKRDEEARANFQAALDRDKVYMPIRYRLADTLIVLGDLAGARKVLEDTAKAYPTQAAAFSMLGQLALRQQRFPDAIAAFTHALSIEPKANELYAHLAEAYAAQGNAAAGADARAKAGNVAPTLDDPLVVGISAAAGAGTAAGGGVAQAQALARQGRIPAAREVLSRILDKNPGDVDALLLSARINAATGNGAIARAQIDPVLGAHPDNAEAWLTSGIVAEYAGDEGKSSDDYRRAQRLDRKLVDPWLMLGNAEMRHGRYSRAAGQYEELVKLQPNTPEAYAHLVAAQVMQDKCEEALQTINGAIAKHANDGDFMQIFVRLASTCAQASKQVRDTALTYAELLYKQRPDAGNSSAYALALAAHGKFKEAQEYQAEAIFEATRARDAAGVAQFKATMQQFVKQQLPDKPWSAEHAYFKAPPLGAVAAANPAPTKKP